MAYAYKLSLNGLIFQFNINPTAEHALVAGDKITIGGRVKWTKNDIKSIRVLIDNGHYEAKVNKTVSKDSYGSFSVDIVLPYDISSSFVDAPNDAESVLINISFQAWTGKNLTGKVGRSAVSGGILTLLRTRNSPIINSVTLLDRHAAINQNLTPYEYFGGYIQGESLPRFLVSFETDLRNDKLTTEFSFIISTLRSVVEGVPKPSGNIVFETTVTAGELANSVFIDAPSINDASASYWFLKATDSSGMSSDVMSDSITILPYTKPTISAYNLQRYQTVLDSPNALSDDGLFLWTTFTGNVAAVANKNAWTLSFTYGVLNSSVSQEISIDSDQNGRAISIAEDSTTDDNDVVVPQSIEFSAANTYQVTATLSDMLNTISSSILVLKAGAYLNVEKTGVAVGQRSTSDSDHKKFEVNEHYISYLNGGIYGVNNYVSGEIKTGGHWIDGRDIYRAIFIDTISSTGSIKIGELSKTPSVVLSVNGSYFLSSDSIFRSLPFVSYANISWAVSVAIKQTREVYIYLGSSNSGSKNYVVIVDYVPVST